MQQRRLDVVISSLTIHNISDPVKQQQALDELLRVLKPNGQFAIFDILSIRKYASYINSKSIITKNERGFYCPRGTILIGRKNKQ